MVTGVSIFALALIVQSGSVLQTQTKGDVWEIKNVSGDVIPASKYVLISEGPTGVTLKDLETSTQVRADKRPDGSVKFPTTAMSTKGWGATDITLNRVSGDSASGTLTMVGGTTIAVLARRLVSVWACAHDPTAHVAKTEDEMRNATAKNGCVGWHKVESQK